MQHAWDYHWRVDKTGKRKEKRYTYCMITWVYNIITNKSININRHYVTGYLCFDRDTFACLFEFEVFAVIATDSKTAEGVLL